MSKMERVFNVYVYLRKYLKNIRIYDIGNI